MGFDDDNDFCCTLEDAVQMSGKPESLIRYWIDRELVGVSFFVPRQDFVVFTKDIEGNRIGHAVCSYRGLLHAPALYIEKVLDGAETDLDQNYLTPCSLSKIKDWRTSRPLSVPLGDIVDWVPREFERTIFKLAYLVPLPTELQAGPGHLQEILRSIDSPLSAELQKSLKFRVEVEGETRAALSYRSGFKYGLKDLRIWYEDVAAQLLEEAKPLKDASSVEETERPKSATLPTEPPLEKIDDLSRLVWRIIGNDLHMKFSQVWAALRADAVTDDPQYDIDGILCRVDNLSLEWMTGDDEVKRLKKSSFRVRHSNLKAKGLKLVSDAALRE